MKICIESNHETIIFAAGELKKYLKMMFPDRHTQIGSFPDGLRVGCLEELKLSCGLAADPERDDVLWIETCGETGFIAGSNPRSVLLAVYEYLRRQGCRWLFPGVSGEYIPVSEQLNDISYLHRVPFRVRGQCIEGAVSQENVLAAIDFAPKIGLNSFMLECYTPFGYYNQWYSHSKSDCKKPEGLSQQTALQWKRQCEAEIEKRGLFYHDMGHGWTSLAFGINPDTNELSVENTEFLAQIGGKRELYKGSAINTNFCMSNEKGRQKFVSYVADYAERHNNVSFLHLWLADGRNNHCECEQCLRFTPSELYVQTLNALDLELTARHLATRIVFICYSDLFWAPVKEQVANSERFLLLFAPFSRDYMQSYAVAPDPSRLMEYRRNQLVSPKTIEENLAYLNKWREKFAGDVFCYEYHFESIIYKDFGGLWTARCAFDDVRGMQQNGFCGMIEDQSQRNAYPTGFGIYAWARALMEETTTFDALAEDYFSHAFGTDWKQAYAFLETVSTVLPKEYMLAGFSKGAFENQEVAANMPLLKQTAQAFQEVCAQHLPADIRCQSVSWQLLHFHCEVCIQLADIFLAFATGDRQKADTELNHLYRFLSEREDFFQNYFDLAKFVNQIDYTLGKIK